MNADDERLAGLHVQITCAASLTPSEQLPEPTVGLNSLHASKSLALPIPTCCNVDQKPCASECTVQSLRLCEKRSHPGPNTTGAAILHTNFQQLTQLTHKQPTRKIAASMPIALALMKWGHLDEKCSKAPFSPLIETCVFRFVRAGPCVRFTRDA